MPQGPRSLPILLAIKSQKFMDNDSSLPTRLTPWTSPKRDTRIMSCAGYVQSRMYGQVAEDGSSPSPARPVPATGIPHSRTMLAPALPNGCSRA